jgi:toxin ParE1/3/4
MAKYYLTHKAVDDLTEIWNYTFEKWSEGQADKYYRMLIDTCKDIAQNPQIGKHYDGIMATLFGFKVTRHIIFYRKVIENDIEIVRILHESMDLKSKIKE